MIDEGLSPVVVARFLSQLASTAWAQLHSGDPGRDGVDNVIPTARQPVMFGPPDDAGITNSSPVTFPAVPGPGQVTVYTTWDAASGGVFTSTGAAIIDAYDDGQNITLTPGAVRISFSPIAILEAP